MNKERIKKGVESSQFECENRLKVNVVAFTCIEIKSKEQKKFVTTIFVVPINMVTLYLKHHFKQLLE